MTLLSPTQLPQERGEEACSTLVVPEQPYPPPGLWPSSSWTSHCPAGNWEGGGSNKARLGPGLTYGGAIVMPASPSLEQLGGWGL